MNKEKMKNMSIFFLTIGVLIILGSTAISNLFYSMGIGPFTMISEIDIQNKEQYFNISMTTGILSSSIGLLFLNYYLK